MLIDEREDSLKRFRANFIKPKQTHDVIDFNFMYIYPK